MCVVHIVLVCTVCVCVHLCLFAYICVSMPTMYVHVYRCAMGTKWHSNEYYTYTSIVNKIFQALKGIKRTINPSLSLLFNKKTQVFCCRDKQAVLSSLPTLV